MPIEDILHPFLDLYYKMPQSIKYIIGRSYRLLPYRMRFGASYSDFKNEYQVYKNASIQELREIQWKKISQILDIAFSQIPYYQQYYRKAGIERKDIHNFDTFAKLPVITKNQIQEHLNDFCASQLASKRLKTNSGGSSGTPVEFYLHKGITRSKEKFYFDEFWSWFGYQDGARITQIRGLKLKNNRKTDYDPIKNSLICSSYQLDDLGVKEIVDAWNKFKPQFFHCYPSTIFQIVNSMEQQKLKLDFAPDAVFASSEPLFPYMKMKIGTVLKTKCVNWYGHSERLVLAPHCEYAELFHVFPLYGYLELIDDSGMLITQNQVPGKMIATGFDNAVMPLIRYDTQDFAQWHGDECEFCHRKWPILERIEGRAIEFIYDKNMKKISITAVIYGQHLKAFKNIKKMQLFQNRQGEVSVRIVKNQAFDTSDAFEIKYKIENVSPDNLLAALEYVDDIPSRKNGKFQFLIQEIK